MKNDLESIAKAIELARAKLENLRQKCPNDADKQDVIDDVEMGLGWVEKRLKGLESEESK